MVCNPALVLADVKQHGEHTLFCRGAGIEVICKDLVHAFTALVHNNLLAAEMGVAEGGSHINNGSGLIFSADVKNTGKALHVC